MPYEQAGKSFYNPDYEDSGYLEEDVPYYDVVPHDPYEEDELDDFTDEIGEYMRIVSLISALFNLLLYRKLLFSFSCRKE